MFKYNVNQNGLVGVVDVVFDAKDVNVCFNGAYNFYRNYLNIKGFRKDNIPKNIIDMRAGKGAVKNKALEIAAQNIVSSLSKTQEIVSCKILSDDFQENSEGKLKLEVHYAFYADLCDYNIALIKREDAISVDDEVKAEVKSLCKKHREIRFVDDAIVDGDVVIADYDGYVDGEPLIGASEKDVVVQIGQNDFLPGLSDALIGKKAGDTVEFSSVITQFWYGKENVGKTADYRFALKQVKRNVVPELSDEFVKKYTEFETVAEYLENLNIRYIEKKQQEFVEKYKSEIMQHIVANSKVEVDSSLIDKQIEKIMESHNLYLRQEHISQDVFLARSRMSDEMFKNHLYKLAYGLVVEENISKMIAERENIVYDNVDKLKEQIFSLLISRMVY